MPHIKSITIRPAQEEEGTGFWQLFFFRLVVVLVAVFKDESPF